MAVNGADWVFVQYPGWQGYLNPGPREWWDGSGWSRDPESAEIFHGSLEDAIRAGEKLPGKGVTFVQAPPELC